MKRIINGKTYNTDTSTLVARSWWTRSDRGKATKVDGFLYLTRGGAFFLVVYEEGNEARPMFEAMTREGVEEWLTTGEVEPIDTSFFQDPPEASDEREPEATLYIRVPRSLKDRLEAKAKDEELSLNSWVTRCVERCLTKGYEEAIIETNQSLETDHVERDLKEVARRSAINLIDLRFLEIEEKDGEEVEIPVRVYFRVRPRVLSSSRWDEFIVELTTRPWVSRFIPPAATARPGAS